MNKYSLFVAILFFIMLKGSSASAQINIVALTDFEIRKAGENSSPYINQTPGDNLSAYTPNIRLFMSAGLSDQWFVNSALQADHYEGEKLSTPFFSLMNINWSPDINSDLVVTLGRFVTPYGSYSTRFLSSENPFVHLPLSIASGLPLSKSLGFLSGAKESPERIEKVYGKDEKGLTMIYQRMYSQGLKAAYSFGESDWLSFDIAYTLAPASSNLDYGQQDSPALTGRVVLKPAIWAEVGVSYSSGTFLMEDPANDTLLIYDLSSYNQDLYGADLSLNYRYYKLNLAYNYSHWKAPYYDQQTSTADTRKTGTASVDHLSAELIIDFPFLVGGYFATRYEKMLSGDIEVYRRDNSGQKVDQNSTTWTYDRERIEFVAGYKLHQNIIFKASYLYSDDTGPQLDDDVFTLQLSVLF